METIFAQLTAFLWSWPLPLALAGTNLMLTLRLRGIQRYGAYAVRLSLQASQAQKGISGFGALATSVGAAMGAGNILGMGVAVTVGGPGAVLWFGVAGVLGMAAQYAESSLSLSSRNTDPEHQNWGGPMLALKKAGYPAIGKLYALFVILASWGTGCVLQARAVVQALNPWHIPASAVIGALVLLSGAVILWGGSGIARASERLVPAMILLYLAGCGGVLLLCRHQIAAAMASICRQAFAIHPLLGAGMGAAIRSGFARGLLAGEAGLGTCGIAAAGADTGPDNQALIAMSAGIWTTLLGMLTGLAITAAGLAFPAQLAGISAGEYTLRVFSLLPGGTGLLAVCLCIFSFTSILGWCYYGQVSARALGGGEKTVRIYKILFLLVLGGALWPDAEMLWIYADLLNGLLALPNLFCLWRLRRQIPGVWLTNRKE